MSGRRWIRSPEVIALLAMTDRIEVGDELLLQYAPVVRAPAEGGTLHRDDFCPKEIYVVREIDTGDSYMHWYTTPKAGGDGTWPAAVNIAAWRRPSKP
jgi:hypothetical protein